MPSPGFRLRGAFRSCHACRLRKVRCIYPEGQEKTCERCRDAGVQCIPAAKATRKSNWRRSVDEAIAQRAPADAAPEQQDSQPPPASPQDLPSYIKPMPAHLSTSAITYLQEGQAFAIPNEKLRDTILESYFEFFHPSMPLVDPSDFADSISGNSGKLSLLLLQSMLFIGSTFIEASILRQLGLTTIKEARKLFFERARLLHEFDCEEDQYISAQALLILSNWYEPTERKETSYWLGCAISAMQTLPTATFAASRANRRLWWSIFLRDRSLTWSSRRTLRLNSAEYKIPELTLEDFCIEASVFTGSRFVRNPEDQEDNAYVCMELIRLYSTISDLILLRYGTQENRAPDPEGNTPATTLFAEHLKWSSKLPENLQYYSTTGGIRSRCLSVQLSMLHLVYWSSVIEFCELLPKHFDLPALFISEDISSPTDLSDHGTRVVQTIFQHLKDSHYLTCIPLGGVVVLCRCIAPLIRQLESLPSANSFKLSRCLAELMDAFQAFRSTYTIAEHIFKVFCLGLRQIILRDPTQVLFLDHTNLDAWNLKNPDSTIEINNLYNNIRLLLLRADTPDSGNHLPLNSFHTPPSSGSASASSQTPDSGQQKTVTASSTPAAIGFPVSETADMPLSELQQNTAYASDFYNDGDLDVSMESDFDTRDLMSTQEFDDFCTQFGFTGDMGMRFS